MTSQASSHREAPRGPSPTALFRRAAAFVPTGVAVLSAADVAMTVSSLQVVSIIPALISVCLARDSHKAAAIIASGGFHTRLLRCGEEELAMGQGSESGDGLVEMKCAITHIHAAGDHDLVLAEVGAVSISDGSPLVYWRRGLHNFRPAYPFLASREEFEKFVSSWQDCTLPKSSWSHAAHVAVAAYYSVDDPEHALDRMRTGICHYNQAAGTANTATSGYHETLTRFWAGILAQFVEGFSDPWAAARHAVERFGEDRDLHYLYYSFDVVRDTTARRTWVPPDLTGP